MIIIYGLRNCEACLKAKQMCEAKDVPHRFVDVMDIDSRVEMREIFGFKAKVPSILWKDEPQTLNEFKVKLMKGEYYE